MEVRDAGKSMKIIYAAHFAHKSYNYKVVPPSDVCCFINLMFTNVA